MEEEEDGSGLDSPVSLPSLVRLPAATGSLLVPALFQAHEAGEQGEDAEEAHPLIPRIIVRKPTARRKPNSPRFATLSLCRKPQQAPL